MANLTGEGVKDFVDAEKALIDSMMKSNGKNPAAKKRTAKKTAARAGA
jgi:hypothetical protein